MVKAMFASSIMRVILSPEFLTSSLIKAFNDLVAFLLLEIASKNLTNLSYSFSFPAISAAMAPSLPTVLIVPSVFKKSTLVTRSSSTVINPSRISLCSRRFTTNKVPMRVFSKFRMTNDLPVLLPPSKHTNWLSCAKTLFKESFRSSLSQIISRSLINASAFCTISVRLFLLSFRTVLYR